MIASGRIASHVSDIVDPDWVRDPAEPGEGISFNRLQEGDDDEVEPVEEPEIFEPRPLKSRRLEVERLGEAGCRAECFGCVYAGEKDTTVPVDDISRLIEMARQSMGRVDLITLAEAMADYYRKMRLRINQELKPGAKPLPMWPAAMILEHLRMHHNDPLVQQVVILNEIQEMRAEMVNHCYEKSNKTGRVRPNKFAIDSYEKLTKLQMFVQKHDSAKMAFTSNGARINPDILSQGVISHHTKSLHDHWRH